MWSTLHRRLDPWWLEPLSGELDVEIGHTSNALAGSPTDPAARARRAPWPTWSCERASCLLGGGVRPVLDLEVLGHGLEEAEYRELCSLQGAVRLGGMLPPSHRLAVGYRAERLLLDQYAVRFAEALRGEIEVEWVGPAGIRRRRPPRLPRRAADPTGGRRRRGRLAVEAGRHAVGGGCDGAPRHAHFPAYDLSGASLAAAARFGLGRGVTARSPPPSRWDDYLHSGGREGEQVFGTTERRRDLLGKVTLGVWLPPWRGLRAGFEWQLARRDSTADDRPGFDFDYQESRARLLLRWTLRDQSLGAAPRAPAGPRAARVGSRPRRARRGRADHRAAAPGRGPAARLELRGVMGRQHGDGLPVRPRSWRLRARRWRWRSTSSATMACRSWPASRTRCWCRAPSRAAR